MIRGQGDIELILVKNTVFPESLLSLCDGPSPVQKLEA